MSDDEAEVETGEAPVDTGLDEQGYHVVSNRGKFQAQMNPLQLKLQEEKRKAEEKRKEAEKKAKLAEKLKAFGGGKDDKKDEDKKDDGSKPKMTVPDVHKGPLDSRMKEMMSAGIVSSTMGKTGTGRGAALLSGRGRGGKAAGRGRGGSAAAGSGDPGHAAGAAVAGGSSSGTTSTSDDSR
jgi:hypothetical protein